MEATAGETPSTPEGSSIRQEKPGQGVGLLHQFRCSADEHFLLSLSRRQECLTPTPRRGDRSRTRWWCIEECPHLAEVLQTHPGRNAAFFVRIGYRKLLDASIFLVSTGGSAYADGRSKLYGMRHVSRSVFFFAKDANVSLIIYVGRDAR